MDFGSKHGVRADNDTAAFVMFGPPKLVSMHLVLVHYSRLIVLQEGDSMVV